MTDLKTAGELHYPILNENSGEIELTRLHFNEKPSNDASFISEFDGGFILMTKNSIISVGFDSHIFFSKTFDGVQLEKISILYDKFLLVQFKNEKFFEIFDFRTGNIVSRQSFNSSIRFIICTTHDNLATQIYNLYFANFLVVLEKGEFKMISLKGTEGNISILYSIPPSGIECVDCCFEDNERTCLNSKKVLATFLNGGICFLENYEKSEEIVCVLPKSENKTETNPLKIQTFIRTGALFIDKNGNLVLMMPEDFKMKRIRMIPGNFHVAYMTNDGTIAAASLSTIYCYYIKTATDNAMYSVYLYTKFVAHVDDIIQLIYDGFYKIIYLKSLFIFNQFF